MISIQFKSLLIISQWVNDLYLPRKDSDTETRRPIIFAFNATSNLMKTSLTSVKK